MRTNNLNRVFIDGNGNGNVGIGTQTPIAPLHVQGSLRVIDRICGTAIPNVNKFWIGLYGTGIDADKVAIGINGNNITGVVESVALQSSGREMMLISNTGVTFGGGYGEYSARIISSSLPAPSDVVQFFQNRNGVQPYWYFNTLGNYGVYSDARLKTNIMPLPEQAALTLIKNIQPIEFNWKEEYGTSTTKVTGFLAQDVLKHAVTEGQKNILTNWESYNENNSNCPHMGLSDHRLLPSIVGTMQYMIKQIDLLQFKVIELENKINNY